MTRLDAYAYVYGHHKTRASLLASRAEGCAICRRDTDAIVSGDSKVENLGYFSIFYVKLLSEEQRQNPTMVVHYGDTQVEYLLVPVGGKTHVVE